MKALSAGNGSAERPGNNRGMISMKEPTRSIWDDRLTEADKELISGT